MTWPGEKEAWDTLCARDSKDVEQKAGAPFNSSDSTYELTCLGQQIRISLTDRQIYSQSALGRVLVNALGEYSRPSILKYLIHAMNRPFSGHFVSPADLPGGDIFKRGTHVLPLDKLAARYGDQLNEFLAMGKSLGGSQLDQGDMSLNLLVFPRVPVVLIAWAGDEEFSPRSSLLFDSSCILHMSTGVIWSTGMMTVGMMLTIPTAHDQATDQP